MRRLLRAYFCASVRIDLTMNVRSDANSLADSSFKFVIPIDSATTLIVSFVATTELLRTTVELVVLELLLELEAFLTGVVPFVLLMPLELLRFILIFLDFIVVRFELFKNKIK